MVGVTSWLPANQCPGFPIGEYPIRRIRDPRGRRSEPDAGPEQKRDRPPRALAVDIAQAFLDQPVHIRQSGVTESVSGPSQPHWCSAEPTLLSQQKACRDGLCLYRPSCLLLAHRAVRSRSSEIAAPRPTFRRVPEFRATVTNACVRLSEVPRSSLRKLPCMRSPRWRRRSPEPARTARAAEGPSLQRTLRWRCCAPD
jgi:hypothetical protein